MQNHPLRKALCLLFVALALVALSGCATSPTQRLTEAVDRGDAAAVREALAGGVRSASAAAEVLRRAGTGNAKAVELLLDAGAASDRPYLKEQALGSAARSGSVDVARLLLDRGAKIDWQAEALAIRPNAPGWAPEVGDAGATRDYANLGPFQAPVGQVANIKIVKTEGAGNTALSLAVINKRTEIVRLLLARGASKETVVIYKDPEFAMLNTLGLAAREYALQPNGLFQVQGKTDAGRALVFKNDGGVIVTNSPFSFERKARIADLAKSIDDEAIRSLF